MTQTNTFPPRPRGSGGKAARSAGGRMVRGFTLRDAIDSSQPHGGTYLGKAVEKLNQKEKYDRLIVITDEQTHDTVPHRTA